MEKKGVEAVERALAILDVFKQGKTTLTLTELAAGTGFYKSTALRLLTSLERCGYVSRTSNGTYQLGIAVFQLGLRYKETLDVEDIVRPILQALVCATNETAAYYIRVGDKRLCLYRVNSPRPARHHLDEGALLPITAGATGHVLTAFQGRDRQDDKDRRTHALGYYVSLGERDPDVASVAVPVLDLDGVAYGALSVSGLMSRYDDRQRALALEQLQRQARGLSRALQKRYLDDE